MKIPIGLVVVSRPTNNFDKGAKVLYQKEIITIEDNVKQFYTILKGKKIPIPGLTQLFFEINTVDPGVLVVYGRSKAATVKVIFVDEQRKWATIEHFSGKQKTVLVDQCRVKTPFLLPLRFDYYEDIQTEFQEFWGNKGNFKPDFLASMNYKAVETKGTWVAVKHDPFERTYYTPEDHEFRVSFEFERSSDAIVTSETDWHKDKIEGFVDFLDLGHYEQLRVKHLNIEDLEDLGFRCELKDRMIYCVLETNPEEPIYLDYNQETHLCKIHDIDDTLFLATILNKSVLKQLLTLKGIPFKTNDNGK